MNLYRKRVLTGLATAGIAAGVLAGGGVALAATGATPAPAAASASSPCGVGYGQFGGMHAQAGQQTVLSAAAGYLGLTQAELRTQLQAGKSFADVAKAEGKSGVRPQGRDPRGSDQPRQRQHQADGRAEMKTILPRARSRRYAR
ncbi:MAG: hypothetical protein ACM3ML_22060 [Micromonosporaceae bacterium]